MSKSPEYRGGHDFHITRKEILLAGVSLFLAGAVKLAIGHNGRNKPVDNGMAWRELNFSDSTQNGDIYPSQEHLERVISGAEPALQKPEIPEAA